MSLYFQRLMAQSGLQTPTPLTTPAPAADTSGADLVEVHEEIPARPAPTVPILHKGPEIARAKTAPIVGAQEEPVQQEPVTPSPEVKSVEETVIVETESVSVKPTVAEKNIINAPAIVKARQPEEQNAAPTAKEVITAVYKWVSANPEEPAPEKNVVENPQPSRPTIFEQTTVVSAAAPRARESEQIPSREIQIVEEFVEEMSPPAKALASLPRKKPDRPPAYVSPSDSPVNVSIGTIQVRVEAPPPVPPVVARTRPAEAPRPVPAPAASRISRLRRHYILPHQ